MTAEITSASFMVLLFARGVLNLFACGDLFYDLNESRSHLSAMVDNPDSTCSRSLTSDEECSSPNTQGNLRGNSDRDHGYGSDGAITTTAQPGGSVQGKTPQCPTVGLFLGDESHRQKKKGAWRGQRRRPRPSKQGGRLLSFISSCFHSTLCAVVCDNLGRARPHCAGVVVLARTLARFAVIYATAWFFLRRETKVRKSKMEMGDGSQR